MVENNPAPRDRFDECLGLIRAVDEIFRKGPAQSIEVVHRWQILDDTAPGQSDPVVLDRSMTIRMTRAKGG